ncbi:MAG: recombinase-like helix-turn-helix domain-containing protein [Cypionkella sp.]
MALRKAVRDNADGFAAGLAPVLEDIRARGHVTLRALAAELDRRGMRTRRGGTWQVSNVRNLIERLRQAG